MRRKIKISPVANGSNPSSEALQLAAQAWCTPETSDRNMDDALAGAFAEILDCVLAERDGLLKDVNDLMTRYADVVADRDRLRAFVTIWDRCEETRGCYSCARSHDVRCPAGADSLKDKGPCVCGRDDLERARAALEGKP